MTEYDELKLRAAELPAKPGIYFFKMTAIAPDGERFSEVRKMIYLK
mgnify:CR=1 FL=1